MEIQFSVGLAIGAVIAAIINIYFNYRSDKKKESQRRIDSANIVIGELLNVIAHYTQYQRLDSRMVDGDERDITKLKFELKSQIYGDFLAVSNVENVSFLPPEQVRNLYQLSMRIRNTDLLISEFISECKNPEMCSDYELELYHQYDLFMGWVEDAAAGILFYIESQQPEFKHLIPEDMTKDSV
ncbi:TPA: hypothetical protein ACPVW6_004695 [Vibrio parahaemolyticus]|uniref:hypothetical protein n=1 Tax=Vibrio parahaemolyticus TaxID=670 RepID=UPI00079FF78B|nr:hypothetical protein [Vibrio parahaemolyticus]EJG0413172.1 hypothetical protein [Vibrio parahaemolyticus]EKC5524314.1 hypothetical protein [Vibrio parahaemolyticus]ELB2259543.1 hypothetical protein [Vibrio parahaemolyticus]KYY38667.1 hypothetical protein AWQ12_07080 [Vibrio parahaemolyticus]MBM4923852.1 hypothetical protein [Vibrio parahaemolyticus]